MIIAFLEAAIIPLHYKPFRKDKILSLQCGFFQRKKMDDVRKWKQQSGYYTKRQSGYYAERESSDNESF